MKDIAVSKRVVYTRATAQSFTEVVYTLVLEHKGDWVILTVAVPIAHQPVNIVGRYSTSIDKY